jgi:3-methyladenine DNA glycosylase AlkC
MKISEKRLHELHFEDSECKNLMEILAIDIPILMKAKFPELTLQPFLPQLGFLKRMQLAADAFYAYKGNQAFDLLKNQKSDMLRGIGCYVLGLSSYPFQEKLKFIKPLADDSNSGVREYVCYAMRPHIIAFMSDALTLLQEWTLHDSERIRRYASEVTRPRGVWCAHIHALRQNPELGKIILEPLKNDPARYVQLSVGNWLNDALKDNLPFVVDLCKRWQEESPTQNTQKICKRGLRNLKKFQ